MGATGLEHQGVTDGAGTAGGRRTHGGRAEIVSALRRTGHDHRRLVALVAAAMVVAGAAGGYVGLTPTGTLSSSERGRPGGRHVATTSQARAGTSAAPVGGGEAGTGSAGAQAFACPMIPGVPDPGRTIGGLGIATHLFTRTTAGGVTIRAYRMPSTTSCTCGPLPNTTTTPPVAGASTGSTSSGTEVLGSDSTSLELSDDTAIGEGSLFDALTPSATTANAVTEPITALSGVFGVREGDPTWWIAAAVGPEVANAKVTFTDGSTDQMAPVDGVAVLAHQIDPSVASLGDGPYAVRGTLQLLGFSGAVISTVTFPDASPPPVPESVPPLSPLAPAGGSTSSATVPIMKSPPTPNDSMIACSALVSPARSPAG